VPVAVSNLRLGGGSGGLWPGAHAGQHSLRPLRPAHRCPRRTAL